jgi:hypothetical protein
MTEYRAYILGKDGHRFMKVTDFLSDQPNDATALKAAEQLTDKHDVEVWDGGRLVARLPPDGVVMSPGLVPSLIFAARSDTAKNSVMPPAEPISLARVSELASTGSPDQLAASFIAKKNPLV